MPHSKAEGIILNTINFRDFDQILTVFTKENGVMKFFFRGGNSQRRKKGAQTSPLTQAEFLYREKPQEMVPCQEISVIHHNVGLRQNLTLLETACAIAQAISRSQLPGHPSPLLYALFTRYLAYLPGAKHSEALKASFLLKLMKHDGHLGEPIAVGLPSYGVRFSGDELEVLEHLTHCRSLNEIEEIEVALPLSEKIRDFFDQCLSK